MYGIQKKNGKGRGVNVMKHLSENQQQVVKHNKGPALVLAGPGSGKTTVITNRTKYLIEEYGVNPSNILVITFTKAAAVEMQERFETLMNGRGAAVTFGTFHSIFFRILKFAYNYNASNIIGEDKRILFLKEVMKQYDMKVDDEKEFVLGILNEISIIKNDRIDLKHYYAKNCSEENFLKLYYGYDRRLREENLIDFDDMLAMTYELLTARQDILRLWQEKYQYILIDEFQDINKIQYEIIRLLALPQNNLFIVGDDDQSIYRFRGARPEIMLGFEKDYPNTKRMLLNINYRSNRSIVHVATRLIENNKERFEKKIMASRHEAVPVLLKGFQNAKEENEQILKNIQDILKDGGTYGEVAILYRTNIGARLLVEKLMEYNIPFTMRDSMPNLFEHWIFKDILCYIQMAKGDRKRETVLQVMNRPNRYIHREALSDSEISFDKIKYYYRDKHWMVERIERLEYDLKMLKQMAPFAAINFIRNGMMYEEYLIEYAKYRRMDEQELLDVLDDIAESAKEFKTVNGWLHHIENYTRELKEQALSKEKIENSVTLSTLHSSKGLEYKYVFIIDINEGTIPHQKAVLESDIEEERRLFYVGITRAKDKLHLYYTKEKYSKKTMPSRFLEEIRKKR